MKDTFKIHVLYVVGILVAVIIALTTSKWGDNPKLVDYVNFAATLTSLVLAVLAIIYAFLSNSSISSSVAQIDEASRNIGIVAADVSAASNALLTKIELIPPQLESVADKMDRLLIAGEGSADASHPLTSEEKKATGEVADIFINKSNAATWVAAYAYFLAYKSGKRFPPSGLVRDDVANKVADMMFNQGVLVTMRATGLLEDNPIMIPEYTTQINSFDSRLCDVLERDFIAIFETKLKRAEEQVEKSDNVSEDLKGRLRRVEEFFHK